MAKRARPEEVFDYCVKNYRHAVREYSADNIAFGRLLDFWDGAQYRRNTNDLSNDTRRLQPKGTRLFDHVRHKTTLLTTGNIYFDVKPTKADVTAEAQEFSKRVIENVIHDPRLRFKNYRRRMVISALAAGRGALAIEHDPSVEGGVCFRVVDPRRLFVCPGFTDLHDPRNPWVIERVPMRLSAVRAMSAAGWTIPDDLRADNWPEDYEPTGNDISADLRDGAATALPGTASETDGVVTVLKCYYRRDPFAQTVSKPKVLDDPLKESEWYWYDDETAERVPADPGSMDMAPPTSLATGQPMRLVTTMEEDKPEYPKGYLVILAPAHMGRKPLFIGDWLPGNENPEAYLCSFPYEHLVCYHHPFKLAGKSDTQLLKTLVVMDNASFLSSWTQLRLAQAILITQPGALQDADGHQFQFTDRPVEIAYATDAIAAETVKFFQMQGMNPATPAFREMIDQQWAHAGNGDIAMPDNRSRDIAVGTIKTLQAQGDLPIRMHAEDLQAEDGIGFRVILDYKRAYMTRKELVEWTDENGQPMAKEITGDMLASANIIVTAAPDWSSFNAEQVQSVAQYVGQMKDVPGVMAALAPTMGFPAAAVAEIKKQAQAMMGPQKPDVDPTKIMQAIAALRKSGEPITVQQLDAAMQLAGLPPSAGGMPLSPPPQSGNGSGPMPRAA